MIAVVYNHKGGVGKSTLAAHVGFAAIDRKIPLTVCDADQQCNTMSWLSGHNWDGSATYQVGTVTVTTDTAAIGHGLTVVDAPPAFQFVQTFPSADVWIIPIGSRFATDGALNVISQVNQVNRGARVVAVLNMVRPDTKFGKMEIEQIHKVGAEVFAVPIPLHEVVRKAEMLGRSAWGVPYGVRSGAASNLQLFADWVLRGCSTRGVE